MISFKFCAFINLNIIILMNKNPDISLTIKRNIRFYIIKGHPFKVLPNYIEMFECLCCTIKFFKALFS